MALKLSPTIDHRTTPPISEASRGVQPVRTRRRVGPGRVVFIGDGLALTAFALATGTRAGLVMAAVILGWLVHRSAYRGLLRPSALDQLPALFTSVAGAVALVAAVDGAIGRRVADGAIALGALLAARAIVSAGIRAMRRAGHWRERALVIGDGELARQLLVTFEEHPESGIDPVVDVRVGQPDVSEWWAGIDCVLVASDDVGPDLRGILWPARLHGIEVYVASPTLEAGLVPLGAHIEDAWGVPLAPVSLPAPRRGAWLWKRAFDVLVSATLIVLLLPVLGAIAFAVKRSSPGPLLFRQRRVGRNGRSIEVLKFRTLRLLDDSVHERAVQLSPQTDGVVVQLHQQADVAQRVTRVGEFLRRSGLDELPQLWNILRGDMSLVGPRPEQPALAHELADCVESYRDRHRLPVGLTGLAQVNGLRGDTSICDRARHDNYYIDHWSFWHDVAVLARTPGHLLRQLRPHRASPRSRTEHTELTPEDRRN
jgi:exopolysaccharide biosynthesis polyprenyl glycosylphosphotransferase